MIYFIDVFTELKFILNEELDCLNNIIFKRDRLLNFNAVFLFICKYNSDNLNTYNSTLSSLIIDNVIHTVFTARSILNETILEQKIF